MNSVNLLMQVAEEKTPIVYKPLFFGNQIFVVAQQNTRRIEEVASYNFGVLTPYGEIIQIDPSQHSALFNLFVSQMDQQAKNIYINYKNYLQFMHAQAAPTQFSLESRSTPCEKMDTSSFHFTCTKSTSSTELTSQNVDSTPRSPWKTSDSKKYILLNLSDSNVRLNEVLQIDVNQSLENCLKLNAREQRKQRKIRNNDLTKVFGI